MPGSLPDLAALSELELRRELLRNRDVLQSNVARKSVLERREGFATDQRREILPRFRRDAEAVPGNEVPWHRLLDIGDSVERRHTELPAIRCVRHPHDGR